MAPLTDTICAISTPAGIGGIAVARLSGPQAFSIAARVWHGKRPLAALPPRHASLGHVTDTHGKQLDQCVITLFPGPASYTGEDTAELSVHGSHYVQQELLASLIQAGARLAQPGEYTRRAVVAGHLDLARAEGLADLLQARSRAAHRVALNQMKGSLSARIDTLRSQLLELGTLMELELDFAEEEAVEFAPRTRLTALARSIADECRRLADTFATGQAIAQGIPVAIIGAPNAGKSTLLNHLCGHDRAIVTDIPGTTRDTLDALITLPSTGLQLRLIDTAGLRPTPADPVEAIGIQRTRQAIAKARIILHLTDPTTPTPDTLPDTLPDPGAQAIGSLPDTAPDAGAQAIGALPDTLPDPGAQAIGSLPDTATIHIYTKADLLTPATQPHLPPGTHLISAATGQGIPQLLDTLAHTAAHIAPHDPEAIIITNLRHHQALRDAQASATALAQALSDGIPTDLAAQHLRDTLRALGLITGAITPDTLLHTIFSRFCIGK